MGTESDWDGALRAVWAPNVLTHEAARLAAYIVYRCPPSARTTRIPDHVVRAALQLHGRSLERAREQLLAHGFIGFTAGRKGPGGGSTYTWKGWPDGHTNVDMSAGSTARATAVNGATSELPALRRSKLPALQRAPIYRGMGKDSPPPKTPDIVASVIDAYRNAGSTVNDKARGALARQATTLAKTHPAETIIAAARHAGRPDNEHWAGDLTQIVREFATNGLPCRWQNYKVTMLTRQQLEQCGCARCEKTIVLQFEPAATAA
jgi:hypothetical protein